MKIKFHFLIMISIFVLISVIIFILIFNSRNKTKIIDMGKDIRMEFVLIKSGSFMMGSDEDIGDEDETPEHQVTITKDFYMGKYEVTQEQWEIIMGNNPSYFKGKKNPVDTVSWNDCQIFLKKLEKKTGCKLSLPTEAQWEYSCRAGTKTKWNYGNFDKSSSNYGWIIFNSDEKTHPAGTKKPNQWGIFDMYGNVGEWCLDWYKNPYSQETLIDPVCSSSGESRIIRGGAWGDYPNSARSASRNCNGPDGKHNGIGFRCVLLITKSG
jgi:formylglycine-generating enzyme required for sulfatase activity